VTTFSTRAAVPRRTKKPTIEFTVDCRPEHGFVHGDCRYRPIRHRFQNVSKKHVANVIENPERRTRTRELTKNRRRPTRIVRGRCVEGDWGVGPGDLYERPQNSVDSRGRRNSCTPNTEYPSPHGTNDFTSEAARERVQKRKQNDTITRTTPRTNASGGRKMATMTTFTALRR